MLLGHFAVAFAAKRAAASVPLGTLFLAAQLADLVRPTLVSSTREPPARSIDRTGRWSLAVLIAFLVVAYLASVFDPPPPDVAAVAWSAQSTWLLVAWGYWIDRHRRRA